MREDNIIKETRDKHVNGSSYLETVIKGFLAKDYCDMTHGKENKNNGQNFKSINREINSHARHAQSNIQTRDIDSPVPKIWVSIQ